MLFWERIKQAVRSFMSGRNGPDQLSMALLWTGLISYLLSSIIGSIQGSVIWMLLSSVLSLAGFASYIFSIFRIFSRNRYKRQEENRRYVAFTEKKRTERRQAKVRFQNRKKYKYFKCPGCGQQLRVPRGKGKITVNCRSCGASFLQKS